MWRRYRVHSVVLTASWLACAALVQAAEPTAEAAITRLESERIEAMLHVDVPALDRILADDLSYIHASGVVDTKPTFLSSLSSGRLKYKAFDRSDVKVRLYGDTVVVTGKGAVQAESNGNPLAVKLFFTDVYVRKGGVWRMVAWQSTRQPE